MKSARIPSSRHALGPRPVHQVAMWALVWALLIAPTIGRWHEAVHGDGSAHGSRAETALVVASGVGDQARAQAPGNFLEHLFSGHARSDCVLLDQATLGYALPSTGMALPAAEPQTCALPAPPERAVRRHVALFQARGPPARSVERTHA